MSWMPSLQTLAIVESAVARYEAEVEDYREQLWNAMCDGLRIDFGLSEDQVRLIAAGRLP